MKKIVSLLLILATVSILCLGLTACKDNSTFGEYEHADEYDFNPYVNLFKPDPDMGRKISVTGKTFLFKDLGVRNKNAELNVAAVNSLRKLYPGVMVTFKDENTVRFIDYGDFFAISEREVERRGNVMQFEVENKTGEFTFTVRIEIHETEIWVIHNAHTYDEPGTYALVNFVDEEHFAEE